MFEFIQPIINIFNIENSSSTAATKSENSSQNLEEDQSNPTSELDALISAFTSPVPSHILTDYDNKSKKKTLIQQQQLRGPVFREFTIHIFQSINFLQNLEMYDHEEVLKRQIDLPFLKPGFKKTIIFDLDETLAHCVRQENPNRPPDVHLNITMMSGKILKAGFNVRPFTKECLEMVNKHFEVVVFTASHKWYADVILDYIDPEGIYFQHRFYREHCI